ncbi:MAG: AbrB/MazE/SpoVT family DNA-binding domain-containing protein, partial [Candidatus Bathyarchaeia archaeon]
MAEVVKVDGKGRVVIPKGLRRMAEVREGDYVIVAAKGKSIVIEPLGPIADRYFGAFKVEEWPRDLDGFLA